MKKGEKGMTVATSLVHAKRHINPGEELLVWYGSKMYIDGMPDPVSSYAAGWGSDARNLEAGEHQAKMAHGENGT